LHPFQTDPGTSQHQRVADALLSDAPPIDGRKLADLLDYFVQLSRHVNYYDLELHISDWQPFFQKSTPFVLATIIKYNHENITSTFELYNKLFDKNPSAQSIRLLLHYIYYNSINRINTWHQHLVESDLPVMSVTEKLIKDKLSGPVKLFIKYANTAAQHFSLKKIDFLSLQKNEVWNLSAQDLVATDDQFPSSGTTKRKRLIALRNNIRELFPAFINVIKTVAGTAELNIEQSLFPLKQELQKQHTPHLGLLFAFLKLFQHLQGDLNSFTRKHLDFFYTEVLKMKPRGADPDKVHIIFEIQNQLDKYLLKKGLQVKDGKDLNKAEVFYGLDDEIVVNKAQVTDVRTLFINNQTVYRHDYVQGLYMAPNALMADGLLAPFTGSGVNSWPTVGSRLSKYTDPELKTIKPYPVARIGFILASPVLLLNEGERTIDVHLSCLINDMCSLLNVPVNTRSNCCGNHEPVVQLPENCREAQNEPVPSDMIFNMVNDALQTAYIHLTEELLQEAIKKGLAPDTAGNIRDQFLIDSCHRPICCDNGKTYISETIILVSAWYTYLHAQLNQATIGFLATIIKPQRAFKLYFSGADKWIEPDFIDHMHMLPSAEANRFTLHLRLVVHADKPAITFYDKDKLQEDFKTELPLLKVELNESVKLLVDAQFRERLRREDPTQCCLDKATSFCDEFLSLYHFFRNVQLSETDDDKTTIKVTVCGLKNFVVQNDESLMDVNSPVYPFGTRPEIVDFNIVNPPPAPKPTDPPLNLIGPNFYIGAKEVFCKKWDNVRINLNWKDKPSSFNEYYKAYVVTKSTPPFEYGLDEVDFKVRISNLYEGGWRVQGANRNLFDVSPAPAMPLNACFHDGLYAQGILLTPANFFSALEIPLRKFYIDKEEFKKFDNKTRNGFVRINLREQDFLHKDYAYVLARQMMALGRLPDAALEGAVYLEHPSNNVIVFKNSIALLVDILTDIQNIEPLSNTVADNVKDVIDAYAAAINPGGPSGPTIEPGELTAILNEIIDINAGGSAEDLASDLDGLRGKIEFLQTIFSFFDKDGKVLKPLEVPIPNEPWTPIIANMAIDYVATATAADIDLIHLYPYKNTFKHEEIELEPALLPTFCDEGNLYIGLSKLVPGSSLNMLFQLAEATADSESEREEITWHYLDNNIWKSLRNGFNVIDDATNGLTTTGIVKFAMPEAFSNENTIMPAGLHWIKAAIHINSRSVSETIGIHTQAIRATFTNEEVNDKMRLAQPLPAGSVAKLKDADTAVKKVSQLYDSFEGRIPEIEGQYYVRVSELLRHKGRAIQKFDYERMVLEAFPQLLKAKCINHSYALNAKQFKNDFPIAPGYVLLAVLPDLNKLKSPQSQEPKVPVSLLEKIEEYLVKRTSPFVRLRAMNARYEKANFCLTVKLYPGKDENYYKEKLEQDMREFLAPWAIGQYDLLTFGQNINRSDIIRFLETRDYLDYLLELRMEHEDDGVPVSSKVEISPKTPRSILIAGHVEVCIRQGDCESWDERFKCGNQPQVLMPYCKNDGPIIN
jgi:hypothetical protein